MSYLSPIEKDFSWRKRIYKEEKAAREFNQKWGWITDDIVIMEEKLHELSKKSEFLKEVFIQETEDKRTIKPIPETINHQYGWISNKKEFQYKIPDFNKLQKLPNEYKLIVPFDSPYWNYLRS